MVISTIEEVSQRLAAAIVFLYMRVERRRQHVCEGGRSYGIHEADTRVGDCGTWW